MQVCGTWAGIIVGTVAREMADVPVLVPIAESNLRPASPVRIVDGRVRTGHIHVCVCVLVCGCVCPCLSVCLSLDLFVCHSLTRSCTAFGAIAWPTPRLFTIHVLRPRCRQIVRQRQDGGGAAGWWPLSPGTGTLLCGHVALTAALCGGAVFMWTRPAGKPASLGFDR